MTNVIRLGPGRGQYERCFGHVYMLIDGDEIVYVGYTAQPDPKNRVFSHRSKKWTHYVLFKSRTCRRLEERLITKFSPRYNKYFNTQYMGSRPAYVKKYGRILVEIKDEKPQSTEQ